MKSKILLGLILLFLGLNWIAAQKAMAVIDFEPINISPGEALALTERFRTEIQMIDTINVTLTDQVWKRYC